MERQNCTFTLQVHDVPSVMSRVAQVLARHSCHVRSLDIQEEPDGQWSTMTINARNVFRPDQIQHQLERLVDVHSATTAQTQ